MTGGSRRLSSPGRGQSERADSHLDAGRDESSGVALQKQIGLFSACGIIIGEFLRKRQMFHEVKHAFTSFYIRFQHLVKAT